MLCHQAQVLDHGYIALHSKVGITQIVDGHGRTLVMMDYNLRNLEINIHYLSPKNTRIIIIYKKTPKKLIKLPVIDKNIYQFQKLN